MRLFIPELGLLLSSVEIRDNKVVAGWVENGRWYYVSTDTNWFCYRDSPGLFGRWVDYLAPVTHWGHDCNPSYIFVDRSLKGPYNEVIEAVQSKPALPLDVDFEELLDEDTLARINERGRFVSGFDDMDDDIPF